MEKHKRLLQYNLQFFAKEGPGGEKTEPATAKKLTDARKDGSVAKSKDLVSAVTLILAFLLLKTVIGNIGEGFLGLYKSVYGKIATFASADVNEINNNNILTLFKDTFAKGIEGALPIMLAMLAVEFIGDLVQVKWNITTKPLKPKMDKLNPIKGFKKIISMQAVINLIKSVCLIIIILFIVFQTIKDKKAYLFNMYEISLPHALTIIGGIVIDLGIKISLVYLIVGIADFIYQKIKFTNDMKMTKQEVKDEFKDSEGDPQIKGQIRQKMRQASMRRMMKELPNADVVITNPTHFAVALKYDPTQAKAPVVIAKGEDFLAQKIKEKARENEIEIVENKPLARALYANVEIGQEIPEELYQAVAEVLAFVYNLKKK